jgi:hypothetical protein
MSLNKRHFFLALFVLGLCLVAADFVIAFLTRNSIPRRYMALAENSRQASVAVFGNSLLVVGFDTAEFDSALHLNEPGRGTVNLAMGSTTPVEHLLFLRYALAQGIRPKLTIYGFLDLQLAQPISLSNKEIIGNHDVLYYLEPEYARQFYHLSPKDSLEFEVMRRFSMLADRSAVWVKVERLRRQIGAQGMPHEETNRFGRTNDFNLLEADNAATFAEQADAAARAPLIPVAEEILKQASQSGAKVIFVEMPMPSRHRRLFYNTDSWRKYRGHASSLVEAHGATYIDGSQWVTDDSLFADHIHLNPSGATVFTRKLVEAVREKFPDLTSESRASLSFPLRNSP